MIDRRRALVYRIVFLALLLGGVLSCYETFAKSRDDAAASAEDVTVCRQLAGRIESLRRKPALAGSAELQFNELTRRIEQAALNARCPAGSIQRISPEADQRVGDSVYKEKPTSVTLRQVTLKQLIVFLYNLTADGSGLDVRNLRLSTPRESDSGDGWSAELTLSYLIYAPANETSPLRTADRN